MRRLWLGMILIGAVVPGCAARHGAPRLGEQRAAAMPPMTRSILLGGLGLDPLAMEIGRSDWPSAFRDEFEGERTLYHEFFYDLQGSPFGSFGHGDFVWRRFVSHRVGSARR